jgi:hypothetical protein
MKSAIKAFVAVALLLFLTLYAWGQFAGYVVDYRSVMLTADAVVYFYAAFPWIIIGLGIGLSLRLLGLLRPAKHFADPLPGLVASVLVAVFLSDAPLWIGSFGTRWETAPLHNPNPMFIGLPGAFLGRAIVNNLSPVIIILTGAFLCMVIEALIRKQWQGAWDWRFGILSVACVLWALLVSGIASGLRSHMETLTENAMPYYVAHLAAAYLASLAILPIVQRGHRAQGIAAACCGVVGIILFFLGNHWSYTVSQPNAFVRVIIMSTGISAMPLSLHAALLFAGLWAVLPARKQAHSLSAQQQQAP